MPAESLGFVKLEWICPKCGSRNPGPQKTCLSCGAPQPENVQFQQAEQQQLITDQKEVQQAKAGADIHCAFCGTRNPAGAKVCAQCGADLEKGVQREAGAVVGAFAVGPVKKQVACPNCGMQNAATALKCTQCGASLAPAPAAAPAPVAAPATKMNPVLIVLGILALVICVCVAGSALMSMFRTEGQTGVVQSVHWETSVVIEALQPVRHEDWRDEIPSEAQLGNCTEKVHHVQDEPAPNSNKVCGTPYTVDKGSGYGEVVQDCQYEVLEEYCQYTVMEWGQVDVSRLEGNDYRPAWPEPNLAGEQRLGDKMDQYSILFQTDKGQFVYSTSDYDLFQQCQVGSNWILNINGLGQVVSIEPAR